VKLIPSQHPYPLGALRFILPFGVTSALALGTAAGGRALADSAGGCPVVGENLVRDGGFEEPKTVLPFYDPLVAGRTIGPWRVDFGGVDHMADADWLAAEGFQSVDLDECQAGGISQDLDVHPGQKYLLCFALAGNCDNGPSVKSVEVRWGDELVDLLTFDIQGRTPRDMGWSYYSYTVTASTGKVALSFRSATPGCYGPAIDDVSVQELPKPL
jgi:choice-of-anchor C domain-containing protein